MNIKRIGLAVNIFKKDIEEVLKAVVKAIPDGIDVVGMKEVSNIDYPERINVVEGFSECDVVITLGGDGTLLRASRLVENEETPLLGIRMRSLGFLTEDDAEKAMSELMTGEVMIQERMRLEISHIPANSETSTYTALNDVVVHGMGVSRVLHMNTLVGNVMLGEYLSDGVIISTPTGSTAYSLAAGGPIINPVTMEAIIVTPLCPHSLSVRPIVISSGEVLTIEVVEEGQETMVTVDGQQASRIQVGEKVVIRKSDKVTRLVTCKDYDFYDLVRRKLRWGGVLRKH
ncbi:MAG: NAD(+)/NADH kinase [Bacteroidales bacterium]|nr:NAD(+)/NADH kinase [Candidatus Latescibacterota bacterium]